MARMHQPPGRRRCRGFTLIEMVMVIVILGVISSMVAVFMRSPVDAYFDGARRATLTDVADTATRRVARDVRTALPNSVRVPNSQCMELIPTKTGGRYRINDVAYGDGSGLDFSAADTGFNMLGINTALPAAQRISQGDVIAVYNLGIAGADAYSQDNTSRVSAAPVVSGAETQISIDSKLFPLASGGNRFQVIPAQEKVVAYVCSGGKLYRTASTTFTSACPATGPVLADNLSSCNFIYNSSDLQRNALVQMELAFINKGESVSIYHEIHVNNAP